MELPQSEKKLIAIFLKMLNRGTPMHIAKAKSGIYRNIHNGKLSIQAQNQIAELCEKHRMHKHLTICAEKQS